MREKVKGKRKIWSFFIFIILMACLNSFMVFATETEKQTAQQYTIKEALQLSGDGKFIAADVPLDSNSTIEIKCSIENLKRYESLVHTSPKKSFEFRHEATRGIYERYGWYNSKVYIAEANEAFVMRQENKYTYINNERVRTATGQSFTIDGGLVMGAYKGCFYYCRVWNKAGKLLAEYLPAVDKNNKACLYDTVSGSALYYTGSNVSVIESAVNDSTNEEQVTESEKEQDKDQVIEPEQEPEQEPEEDIKEEIVNTGSTISHTKLAALKTANAAGNFKAPIKLSSTDKVEVKVAIGKAGQYANLFSAYTNASNRIAIRQEATRGIYVAFGWYNSKIYSPEVDEAFTLTQDGRYTYVNDQLVRAATNQKFQVESDIQFGKFKGNIYYCKIWDSAGELKADYEPVRMSDGTLAMYDEVSKTYLKYSGSGLTAIEEEVKEDNVEETPSGNEGDNIEETPSDNEKDDTEEEDIPETEQTLYDVLKKMLLTGDDSVHDISGYKIKYIEMSKILNQLAEGECYLAHHTYGAVYESVTRDSEGYLLTIQLNNVDSGFASRYQAVQETVKNVLAGMDNKMTDLDKIVYAHEYVVEHTTYKNEGLYSYSYSAGGPLGVGTGVCQGYAKAVQVLLHEMGMTDVIYVSGKTLNHGWLYVKVDSEWYHVDPTWDDTRSGSDGSRTHEYLIRNDAEFAKSLSSKHIDWFIDNKPADSTSTAYTNWFVHDVKGIMRYYDGLWYYQDSATGGITRAKLDGTKKEVVIAGDGISKASLVSVENGIVTYKINNETYSKTID